MRTFPFKSKSSDKQLDQISTLNGRETSSSNETNNVLKTMTKTSTDSMKKKSIFYIIFKKKSSQSAKANTQRSPIHDFSDCRDDDEFKAKGDSLLLDDNYEDRNEFPKRKGIFKRISGRGNRRKQSSLKSIDNEEDPFEEFRITRVDTYHADIDIPLSAKSGEFFIVDHDGEKQIKVPSGGYQGKAIRVKMIKGDEPDIFESESCLFCCSVLPPGEETQETNNLADDQSQNSKTVIRSTSTPVDDDHADIDIPLSAKSGEFLGVDHYGEEKLIKVPSGGYQGQSIRVRMKKP